MTQSFLDTVARFECPVAEPDRPGVWRIGCAGASAVTLTFDGDPPVARFAEEVGVFELTRAQARELVAEHSDDEVSLAATPAAGMTWAYVEVAETDPGDEPGAYDIVAVTSIRADVADVGVLRYVHERLLRRTATVRRALRGDEAPVWLAELDDDHTVGDEWDQGSTANPGRGWDEYEDWDDLWAQEAQENAGA